MGFSFSGGTPRSFACGSGDHTEFKVACSQENLHRIEVLVSDFFRLPVEEVKMVRDCF